MGIPGRVLLEIVGLIQGSSSTDFLRSIQSEPYEKREEILVHQFQQLSTLLTIAETHVPYYRELFRSLGIHARDIRCQRDLVFLPVLTKDIVRERADDLVREDVPKEKLIVHYTGGSTGIPVKSYVTRRELDLCDAGMFRCFQQSGWRPGEMIAFFWGDRDRYKMSNWMFEVRQQFRRMYQFDAFHSGPDQMDKWITTWNRVKPKIVFGYSSVISRFAEHIERTRREINPVVGVFTTAEQLYPRKRQLLSDVFCCPVYDMYGSSEVNNIAHSCSHGRMHINLDNVVLEADRTGLEPGQPSAFIVTSLCNHVMPFIRYQIQDCGELLDDTCDCGNQFPLMDLAISRSFDHFILPDGRFVHGMLFTRMMDVAQGISTFQFHQTAHDSITLWIVPAGNDDVLRQHSIQSVLAQLAKLDARIKVEVRVTDKIPPSHNGKHRFIRSDVADS